MTPGNLLACLLVDGWLVGLPVAAILAAACRLARGTAPRARYLAAVAGFVSTVALAADRALGGELGRGVLAAGAPAPAGLSAATPHAFALKLHPVAGAALAAVWIAVALVLLGRELGGHRHLRRLRRRWQSLVAPRLRGCRWPDRVPLLTDREPSGTLPDAGPGAPMTVGLLRPAVFLPRWIVAEIPRDGLCAIARHELAHARWRDPLVTAALRTVRLALWPVLPLWAIEAIARRESEAAADRSATEGIAGPGSGDRPSAATLRRTRATYARALLEVARRSAPAASGAEALVAAPLIRDRLGARLRRVIEPSRPTALRLAGASLLLLVGAAAAIHLPTAQALPDSPRDGGRAEAGPADDGVQIRIPIRLVDRSSIRTRRAPP